MDCPSSRLCGRAGDQVTVTIDQVGGTEWEITFTDNTNGLASTLPTGMLHPRLRNWSTYRSVLRYVKLLGHSSRVGVGGRDWATVGCEPGGGPSMAR